jgi:ABC-2 type transport system ATP-binding protein
MDEAVVSVKNLTKIFKKFTAVSDVSFEIRSGEIMGLLGPNGAGKTTTISMLLGLTLPTSGEIRILGKDVTKERSETLKEVNFASAYSQLQGRITVWENLTVFAHLFGIKNREARIKELLENLEITKIKNKQFQDLSAGQKTRVILAKSLLNNPKVLLLDEPTASLDPDISEKIQNLLLQIRKQYGTAILYTSHDMAEVTKMCDRIIFLSQGKIVAADTPFNLTKKIKKCSLVLTFEGDFQTVEYYLKTHEFKYSIIRPHVVKVELEAEEHIAKILVALSKEKVWITDVEVEKPSLEDVFLQIARGGRIIDFRQD